MKVPHFGWLWTLFLFLPVEAGAATILDDTFADGDRTTQSLPASAAWYYGATTATNLHTSSSGLQFATLTNDSGILATLPSFTLGTGQSATVSFTFSATGIVSKSNSLRVGLFNSAGAPASADGWNTASGPAFAGYGVWGNMGNSGGTTTSGAWYRTNATGSLFSGSVSHPETGTGADYALADGQSYTGTLTILNNGASDTISFSLNGVTVSSTDSARQFNTFDTLAFLLPANGASSLTFTEIRVDTSAVPEPGGLALAALGAMALALGRRRSRAHV